MGHQYATIGFLGSEDLFFSIFWRRVFLLHFLTYRSCLTMLLLLQPGDRFWLVFEGDCLRFSFFFVCKGLENIDPVSIPKHSHAYHTSPRDWVFSDPLDDRHLHYFTHARRKYLNLQDHLQMNRQFLFLPYRHIPILPR